MTDLDARVFPPAPFDDPPLASPEVLQIVERFQSVMVHFLDVQREVMLRCLAGDGDPGGLVPDDLSSLSFPPAPSARGVPAPPAPAVPPDVPVDTSASPEPVDEPAAPVTPVRPQAAERATPADAPPAADAPSAVDVLLDIVEARTGYPRDMLDLDLHMESDLGMDSIKRVEIIGTLCRTMTPDQVIDPELIEALTRERTLRALAEHFDAARSPSHPGMADRDDPDQEGD